MGRKRELHVNKRTGLLETKPHDYRLHDVPEAELYRGIFDFDEVPKTIFNDLIVPRHMPEHIFITDTTFRDGQQSTAPFSVEQICEQIGRAHV